jgi:hypothetical protein
VLALSMLKIAALSIVVGVVGVIGLYIVFVYVMAWMHLAMVQVLIDKVGAMDAIKKVKPLIWGYFIYTFFYGLFLIGLIPFGILSLGIVLLLWVIWNMFGIFVYLDYKEAGLRNLWHSKALINQRFWGVVMRIAIVYVGYYVIMMILGASDKNNGLLTLIIFVLSFVIAPFLISYLYEMYLTLKTLQKDLEVKPSKIWVGLSVLGGIILILSIIGISSFAISQGPALMKEFNNAIQQKQDKMPKDQMIIPTTTQKYTY